MDENNLFEYATRKKLRFQSVKGELTAEQLWDVPLRSTDGFNLDAIAKGANKAYKDATEQSFVAPASKTPAIVRLEMTFEVVKRVIAVLIDEEERGKKVAANKKEKDRLLEILSEKEASKLAALSEKEILRRVKELEES